MNRQDITWPHRENSPVVIRRPRETPERNVARAIEGIAREVEIHLAKTFPTEEVDLLTSMWNEGPGNPAVEDVKRATQLEARYPTHPHPEKARDVARRVGVVIRERYPGVRMQRDALSPFHLSWLICGDLRRHHAQIMVRVYPSPHYEPGTRRELSIAVCLTNEIGGGRSSSVPESPDLERWLRERLTDVEAEYREIPTCSCEWHRDFRAGRII